MGREASLICVSPLQNSTNPSVVPGPSTFTSTSGFSPENPSATRLLIGRTVEDPETLTDPDRFSDPPPPLLLSFGLSVEHAAPSNANAARPTAASLDIFLS